MADYSELCRLADEARKSSYCIYSDYAVGAALLTKDGHIYQGCNIENASYPAGICAERTAFSKAISEGERHFEAIAIAGGRVGEKADAAYPCGVCRQFMNEFTERDFRILVLQKDGSYSEHTMDELLPFSFGPKSLNK